MTERNILVVDDEKNIQRVLKRILERLGHQVYTADDTRAARRILRLQRIDLVLCDYLMPGENGIAFLHELKRSHPDTIRVMITGNGNESTVISALNKAQVQHFFTKPFDVKALGATIEELLDRFPRGQKNPARPYTARQQSLMAELKHRHPGIDQVERDLDGAIVLDEDIELFTKELEEILGHPAASPIKKGQDAASGACAFLKTGGGAPPHR